MFPGMSTGIAESKTMRRMAFAAAMSAVLFFGRHSMAQEQPSQGLDASQPVPAVQKVELEDLPFRRTLDMQIGASVMSPFIAGAFDGSLEAYPIDHFGLGLSGGYIVGPSFGWITLYGAKLGMDFSYRFDLAVVKNQAKGSEEEFSLP